MVHLLQSHELVCVHERESECVCVCVFVCMVTKIW